MNFPMIQKQWDSLVELCSSLCDSCNISPTNIRGHRDFSNTACPGDWLYSQLPRLRKDVADKLGLEFIARELENESSATSVSNLKFGSTGLQVMKLQEKLLERGFNPGAADGIFGENTHSAVVAFQRSVGIEDDGIVGINTSKYLD